MYFGIFLIESKQNILIPLKWIFGFDVNYLLNNGVDTTEVYLVYYAKYLNKNANFLAQIRHQFDSNDAEGSCYYGKIFKIFGN